MVALTPSWSLPRLWEAVVKAVGIIGASEVGDKTFFIAAILAMRNPRLVVSRDTGVVGNGRAKKKCGRVSISCQCVVPALSTYKQKLPRSECIKQLPL